MLSVEINKAQLNRLKGACFSAGKTLPRELAGALNQVAKKTRLEMGRDVRNAVSFDKKESEAPLSITAVATSQNLSAVVRLKKTARLGLNRFGARQDKRGVSYKISKKSGRSRVEGAFQGPRPGVMKTSWNGNAFKRVGKSRLPIVKLKAVSVFGVYVKNNMGPPQAERIADELHKQMERRINLNVLRANGLVKT